MFTCRQYWITANICIKDKMNEMKPGVIPHLKKFSRDNNFSFN